MFKFIRFLQNSLIRHRIGWRAVGPASLPYSHSFIANPIFHCPEPSEAGSHWSVRSDSSGSGPRPL